MIKRILFIAASLAGLTLSNSWALIPGPIISLTDELASQLNEKSADQGQVQAHFAPLHHTRGSIPCLQLGSKLICVGDEETRVRALINTLPGSSHLKVSFKDNLVHSAMALLPFPVRVRGITLGAEVISLADLESQLCNTEEAFIEPQEVNASTIFSNQIQGMKNLKIRFYPQQRLGFMFVPQLTVQKKAFKNVVIGVFIS